jgi:nitroreductase
MRARHSVRTYQARSIEEEKLQQILAAANRAPSAGNLQAYEIVLVRDASVQRALVRAALDQEFLAQAPIVLVFCTHGDLSQRKYGPRGADLYCLQDATIACAYAQLAAAALGLGSVWVGAFHPEAVARAIGIPHHWRPVALLPIGYAAEEPLPASRRPLNELVHEIESDSHR